MEFDLGAHMLKGFVHFLILSHFNYTLREIFGQFWNFHTGMLNFTNISKAYH